MSAIAPIVINDGKATPVAHTLNPVRSTPDAFYREALAGLGTVGNVSTYIKYTQTGDSVKVILGLTVPSMEVVTGANSSGYSAAPKVSYENKVTNVQFILPLRGTPAERKDLRTLLINLLANAQVVDCIDNLNPPY